MGRKRKWWGRPPQGTGYHGKVSLVSPSGEIREVKLPGRHQYEDGVRVSTLGYSNSEELERNDRRFRRLLSLGWKVVRDGGRQIRDGVSGEEERKETDEVNGSTKTGNRSHGGDHASKEVKDSPNAAQNGERRERGQRSRRRKEPDPEKRREKKRQQKRGPEIRRQGGQRTGSAVYSPTPIRVNAELLKSSKRSAELLAELVGRAASQQRHGVRVDAERLLVALEVGDNPLPALEWPVEKPHLRVLVTPDCSGSTQNWSGLGQGWALHLAKLLGTDVVYVENNNGEFRYVDDEKSLEMVRQADIVIYLGDGDGYELCRGYAQSGGTVVGLDTSCSAKGVPPELYRERHGQGEILWVDGVTPHRPETWTKAIELALGR